MKKQKTKEKHTYCFPNIMAKAMKKIDDRTQMEASLLSMAFLLVGLLLVCVYITIWGDFSWWFKGMTIFNSLCGFIFLSSYLVTVYQQYVRYMETAEIIGAVGTDEPFEPPAQLTQQIKQLNIQND